MNEIRIPCEGSGYAVHSLHVDNRPVMGGGMCRMCGRTVTATGGLADDHQRDDILARIERGDFG